ncbi:SCO2584 family spore wall biosynthesis protein [Streptomyces sp. NPDC002308]
MDDAGGRPFPDGSEPDDDRGGADEDFATVVFDEDFVRAARIHEPTAVERLVAAAEARAEAEATRSRSAGAARDGDPYDHYGPGYAGGRGGALDPDDLDYDPGHGIGRGPYGPHGGSLRPYRGSARWHRPVAWLLALVMGIGMVALAFSAVYRGTSADSQGHVPPATSGVDTTADPAGPADLLPSAPVDRHAPAAAVPHTP